MRTPIAAIILSLTALTACGSGSTSDPIEKQSAAATTSSSEMTASSDMVSPGRAATTGWTTHVERTADGGYRMGNPAAPIKLIEYGARTCPACRRFAQEGMEPLKARYVASGKVSYEFRDFLIHGAPDLAAALVGQCGVTSSFFPILEADYARQDRAISGIQSTTPAEQAALKGKPVAQVLELIASKGGYIASAQQHGIDLPKAKSCLADQKAMDRLVKITDTTSTAIVPGTPSFILNGKRLDGSSWSAVEAALRKAGA